MPVEEIPRAHAMRETLLPCVAVPGGGGGRQPGARHAAGGGGEHLVVGAVGGGAGEDGAALRRRHRREALVLRLGAAAHQLLRLKLAETTVSGRGEGNHIRLLLCLRIHQTICFLN